MFQFKFQNYAKSEHLKSGAKYVHQWSSQNVSLPLRLAILTGLIVIGIPLFVLFMAALIFGTLMFITVTTVLKATYFIKNWSEQTFSKRDASGRRNVRVIED